MALVEAVTEFGAEGGVAIEATYGWYWAVDLLRDEGLNVHLAHPAGNDWGKRRVEIDERERPGPRGSHAARASGRGLATDLDTCEYIEC